MSLLDLYQQRTHQNQRRCSFVVWRSSTTRSSHQSPLMMLFTNGTSRYLVEALAIVASLLTNFSNLRDWRIFPLAQTQKFTKQFHRLQVRLHTIHLYILASVLFNEPFFDKTIGTPSLGLTFGPTDKGCQVM